MRYQLAAYVVRCALWKDTEKTYISGIERCVGERASRSGSHVVVTLRGRSLEECIQSSPGYFLGASQATMASSGRTLDVCNEWANRGRPRSGVSCYDRSSMNFSAAECAMRTRHDNVVACPADAPLLKIYPRDHRDGNAWNHAHGTHSMR
jgi:hypothetical protein